MIAFYVQGGGLGHLSRTHKLINLLKIDAKEVLIITPSQFTHFFKQYQFVSISWHDGSSAWTKTLLQVLMDNSIQSCYIDAFPLGIKGELIPIYKALPHISFNYTCRVLKWKKYQNDIPEAFAPNFKRTILLEKIYEDHYDWIKANSSKIEAIQLPVFDTTKQVRLTEAPFILVIHSGGKEDVIRLCEKAKAAEKNSFTPLFVFTQVSIELEDERFQIRLAEYPIEQFFQYADKIYTAAGFNLMNELAPYHKKHVAIPIDRLYDDQYFRTKNRGALLMK